MGMKLTQLDGQLLKITGKGGFRTDATMAEAQGVLFICPKCYATNKGKVGTHSIIIWFRDKGVPAEMEPKPRWLATGTSIDDLTCSPSVALIGDCAWHGWIRNGDAT